LRRFLFQAPTSLLASAPLSRRAGFAGIALFLCHATAKRLLQRADRTATAYETHSCAVGSFAEPLHHVVPDEIGKQNDNTDPRGQGGHAATLMSAVAAADVYRNADTILLENFRDIAQPVSPNDERVRKIGRGNLSQSIHSNLTENNSHLLWTYAFANANDNTSQMIIFHIHVASPSFLRVVTGWLASAPFDYTQRLFNASIL
jgi:hypothetical protein